MKDSCVGTTSATPSLEPQPLAPLAPCLSQQEQCHTLSTLSHNFGGKCVKTFITSNDFGTHYVIIRSFQGFCCVETCWNHLRLQKIFSIGRRQFPDHGNQKSKLQDAKGRRQDAASIIFSTCLVIEALKLVCIRFFESFWAYLSSVQFSGVISFYWLVKNGIPIWMVIIPGTTPEQTERSHCSAGESKNRGGVRWDGLPPNQMVAPTDPAGWAHPGAERWQRWKCPDFSRVLWNTSPHRLVYCHRILLQMGYMFISKYIRTNYNIIYFLPAYWWITYQNHSSHSSNSWPTSGPRLQRWDKIRPNSHHCGHPSARSGWTKRGSATWPQMGS